MNTVSIVAVVISGLMLIMSVINSIVSNSRQNAKDIKERDNELSSLQEGIFKANMKLDQVCATTNETRSDIKAMDQKLVEHGEKIAVLTRDLETAFMRIDELRESKEDKK